MFEKIKEKVTGAAQKAQASMDTVDMLIKTVATPDRIRGLFQKLLSPKFKQEITNGIDKKLKSFELQPDEDFAAYVLRAENGEPAFTITSFKSEVIFNDASGKKVYIKSRTLEKMNIEQFIMQFLPAKKPVNNPANKLPE